MTCNEALPSSRGATAATRSGPDDSEEEYETVGAVPTPTFLWLVADALEQHACVVVEADMADGLGNLVGSDLGAAGRLRRLGNKLETLIFADDEEHPSPDNPTADDTPDR